MQLFSADPKICSKKKKMFVHETYKNGPQKLLIIGGPNLFFFTVRPRPQLTAQNWFFILWNLGTRHLFSYLCFDCFETLHYLAKVFWILYPQTWNPITGIAILMTPVPGLIIWYFLERTSLWIMYIKDKSTLAQKNLFFQHLNMHVLIYQQRPILFKLFLFHDFPPYFKLNFKIKPHQKFGELNIFNIENIFYSWSIFFEHKHHSWKFEKNLEHYCSKNHRILKQCRILEFLKIWVLKVWALKVWVFKIWVLKVLVLKLWALQICKSSINSTCVTIMCRNHELSSTMN